MITPPSATLTPLQEDVNAGSLLTAAFSPSTQTGDNPLRVVAQVNPYTPDLPEQVGSTFDPLGFEFRGDASTAQNYSGEWVRNLRETTGMTGRGNPLVITTDEWINQGRYIIFWAGPESVQWNMGMRGTTQETRGGLIQHFWKDPRRNSFMNEPEMSITFQTGNIMPVRVTQDTTNDPYNTPTSNSIANNRTAQSIQSNTVVQIPFGLMNLYEFMELLESKRTMSDGTTNYVNIMYSSLAFPKIILRGFFSPEAGMSFQEAAMENAEIKWATSFRVTNTYPKFRSAQTLRNTWEDQQRRYGYSVAQSDGSVALDEATLNRDAATLAGRSGI